jgi:hypothetical protein
MCINVCDRKWYKNKSLSKTDYLVGRDDMCLLVPSTQEAAAEGSLEARNSRPAWAT